MNILITGARGYIGGLLIEKFIADPSIETIICIDLLPLPAALNTQPKIHWVQADLAGDGWQKKIADIRIDAVIHCAFKIRNPYGKTKETEIENIAAAKNIFSFAFDARAAQLVYLSSVAAYGAKSENIGLLIRETHPLTETVNPYGYQKALVEEVLKELMVSRKPTTNVSVLRLNSVTGPRGQTMKSKFGLITFIRKVLPFIIEADRHWARQFVHEEDVAQAIILLATHPTASGENPAIFNLAPQKFLTARDMGKILGKKILPIPKWLVRPLFFLAWHGTHGRIPTPPESANGLVYPINVDGSKIEARGFKYRYTAEEALLAEKK